MNTSAETKTTPNTIYIGISGKAFAGKTTTAHALEALSTDDVRVCQLNLADPLKGGAAREFGFPVEWCYTSEGKRRTVPGRDFSVGELLQQYGEMYCREFGADYWARKLLQKAEGARAQATAETLVLIVADVRKPLEVDTLRDSGSAIVVRLAGDPGNLRGQSTRDHSHVSEVALDNYTNFDATVNTDETCLDDVVTLVSKLASEKFESLSGWHTNP